MKKNLHICYILESTELCGGVRVVFDQARALQERGHKVSLLSFSGDHSWYPYEINVRYISNEESLSNEPYYDIVISTFWTTVEKTLKMNTKVRIQLCQGYEGDTIEYSPIKSEIERVYRIQIPKIVIGSWLRDRLSEIFGHDFNQIYVVGQIVDTNLYKPQSFIKRFLKCLKTKKLNILIVGAYQYSVKAIADGLKAVAMIRKKGYDVNLIRVSYTNEDKEESMITPINEYHSKITPIEMRAIYYKSDISISPSLSNEGFGLPFAEALSCGIPTIATSIPSHMSLDEKLDYAIFVPQKDIIAISEAIELLIQNPYRRFVLSQKATSVIREKFSSKIVGERLEMIFFKSLD
ncbi:MAG: glycosyltransferase family 4 protein [Thermodesulfovibrionales bacterium]|nr:glycosyltransferase family 4 protein [Thermodesulfovibrionales bacterium]